MPKEKMDLRDLPLTLSLAGLAARFKSSNADPGALYGLDPKTRIFIEEGYKVGASGVFDPATNKP